MFERLKLFRKRDKLESRAEAEHGDGRVQIDARREGERQGSRERVQNVHENSLTLIVVSAFGTSACNVTGTRYTLGI